MIDVDGLDWDKGGGLMPAVVQDRGGLVRMVGYMNRAALDATLDCGLVTFFSRSKGRLWVKGETSGNRLVLVDVIADCDRDALLVTADAEGPTCHTGEPSCFPSTGTFFPGGLERVIASRATADPSQSYTARLLAEGPRRIAQKLGEEGVEVALAAVSGSRADVLSEAADLAFHLTVLLHQHDLSWTDVADELARRHENVTLSN